MLDKVSRGFMFNFFEDDIVATDLFIVLESTSPHACHDNSCNNIVCCPLSLPGGKSAFHPQQICLQACLGFGMEFCK